VLSLHIPWTAQTNKMVDAAFIYGFEKLWILIPRENIVTTDLVAAMRSGKILGAGLDVLEYENCHLKPFSRR
jgi:D-3-phosphoglycerate dehydrogenase